jgi:hypothetical protein
MLVNKTIYDIFRLFVLSVEVPVFFNRSAVFSNNEPIVKVASIKPTDDALEVFISALNKQSVLLFNVQNWIICIRESPIEVTIQL